MRVFPYCWRRRAGPTMETMTRTTEEDAGPPPSAFERSRADRMIAGVANGSSKYLNVGPSPVAAPSTAGDVRPGSSTPVVDDTGEGPWAA
jgi:hypothetical protein